MYRKRTLRRMPPVSRDFAKLLGEAVSALNRMKSRTLPQLIAWESEMMMWEAEVKNRQLETLQTKLRQVEIPPEPKEEPEGVRGNGRTSHS